MSYNFEPCICVVHRQIFEANLVLSFLLLTVKKKTIIVSFR